MSFECSVCGYMRELEDIATCKCSSNPQESVTYFCINYCSDESHNARDCTIESHKTCFERHIPDVPKLRPKHQQINAWLEWCVQQITFASDDREEQRRLHQNDQRAEWFRVEPKGWTPASGTTSLLQVSQRFDKIWRAAIPARGAQYPSFVSLMGASGSGKSHLVRAMMMIGMMEDMKLDHDTGNHRLNQSALLECRARGPVTRSRVADLGMTATSVGVHLYHDSAIAKVRYTTGEERTEDVSILFADCEGFYADTTMPTAISSTNLEVPNNSRSRAGSFSSSVSDVSDQIRAEDVRNRLQYREIPIRAPKLSGKGKEGAELFYARYLYAFSDVVLFVTERIQTLGSELKNFLVWIAKAEKQNIPPRSPRTLIVVVNNSNMDASEDHYREQFLKDNMLNSLGNQKIWESSDELSAIQEKYDSGQVALTDRITTNDKFFKLFFQKVRCCYIPGRGKDSVVRQYEQYKKLREMIEQGSKQSQESRSERWSRYDVSAVSQLLDQAFEHFANSDDPFDFHNAARKDNPIPVSLSGHMANLLRHTGASKQQLYRFVDVLSICLIIYEYRTSVRARAPEEAFETDLRQQCLDGIRIYQSKFQPCAYLWHDRTYCTTRGFEHDERQGHRHKDGMMVRGVMNLKLFEIPVSELLDGILRHFVAMYEILHAARAKPELLLLNNYRKQVLGYEPQEIQQNLRTSARLDFSVPSTYFSKVFSNKTCFACLQAAPDHFLACGHGLCVDCVKDFAEISQTARYQYEISQCILCGTAVSSLPRHMGGACIRLDPRAAGVRILSLDGGGIRGIVELKILQRVETQVNLGLPIRELFDLIMGVSTGGIISLAIATGAKSISTLDAVTQDFRDLARKIFERDRLSFLTNTLQAMKLKELGNKIGTGLVLVGLMESRYPSQPRSDALRSFFSADQALFGTNVSGEFFASRATRVAVTASSRELCTFSNYNRDVYKADQAVDRDHLRSGRGFIREEFPQNEPRIWEAAMATSAAPGYFVPWKIADRAYTDGAVQSNIPFEHALEEKELIWPASKLRKVLDLAVSVGTGYSSSELSLPWWLKKGNMQEVIQFYHDNILNSENIWNKFVSGQKFDANIHHRLNVLLPEKVDLDDWRQIIRLEDMVDKALDDNAEGLASHVDRVAFRLVAKLLFFEPEKCVPASERKKEYVKGHIWTRLDCRTQQLAVSSLMSRITEFYHQEGSGTLTVLRFHVPDPLRGGSTREPWSKIKRKLLDRSNQPLNLPCNFDLTTDLAVEQNVLVGLLDPVNSGRLPTIVSISGFPVSYGELRGITITKRGVKSYPE